MAVTDATDFDDDTIHLAKQLVEKMSKPFDPASIKDEYTEALKNIIMAKAEGKVVTIAEVKREQKSISLKDALAGSLKEAVNF
jgi:DNA end-binding protein Ku